MKMGVTSRTTLLAANAVSLLLVFSFMQTASAGNQGLGEKCTYDADCEEAHAYCDASGIGCDCKAGFTKSINKTKCLSVEGIFELGAKCEEDVQCAFTEKASACKGGQCRACDDTTVQCNDPTDCALHDLDGKCWKSRKIGDSCNSDEECWIIPDVIASRKCETTCICSEETEKDKCKQSQSDSAASENGAAPAEKSIFWATIIAVVISTLSPSNAV